MHAISELLLLQEQARSMVRQASYARWRGGVLKPAGVQGELAVNYSHALAQAAQSGQMFGVSALPRLSAQLRLTSARCREQESLQKLALKRDPRPETFWRALCPRNSPASALTGSCHRETGWHALTLDQLLSRYG